MDAHDAGSPPPPAGEEPRPDEERPPRTAWRLTFEYEGDSVRVVGRQQVEMQAPPDESALLEGAEDGYWVEVRDREDQPVYRQVLHEPIQTEYEVFSPEGSMHHVPAPEVKGVFQAVVPDLARGDAVVLHGPSSPAGDEGAERRADETGRAATDAGEAGATPPPSRRARREQGPRTLLVARLREESPDPPPGPPSGPPSGPPPGRPPGPPPPPPPAPGGDDGHG